MWRWPGHKGLLLSLVGNALLAVAVLWALTTSRPMPATAEALPVTQAGQEVALQWRQIRASDYAAYARNLRALGCPEASVIDLIVGEVTARFSERWRAELRQAPVEFWESAARVSSAEQARLSES